MSKVAFLFLTRGEHNNVSLWEHFFQGAASPEQYKIVIHAKNPEQLKSPLWANNAINNIPTAWGTISLVKATIFLLQCALADPLVTNFVLLSESCLPTTSFGNVYAHLTTHSTKSYIHYTMGKNMDRYNMIKAYLPPKVTPNLWAKQSQWMCLTRKHVQILFVPPYQTHMLQWLNDFKYCPVPDEHFFINFYLHICRLPESDFLNSPMTYVDWPPRSQHPTSFAFLPRKVIDMCRTKQILFARKFYPLRLPAPEVAYLFPPEAALLEKDQEQKQEQEQDQEQQEQQEQEQEMIMNLNEKQKYICDYFASKQTIQAIQAAILEFSPTQLDHLYTFLKTV